MRSTIVRVLAAAGIAALLATAVPSGDAAAATVPRPTAKVDVHQVLAGSQQPFALTVANPIGAGRITAVRVSASAGLFAIAAPVDVAGWTGIVKNGFLTFTAAPGGGIATGSSKAFGFLADAQRPAQDANAAWSVSTSTDTGTVSTYTAANPTAPGALGTRVRTLEILDITVTAPEQLVGDDSLYVTTGQDNVVMAVRVANAASAPQTATVTLTDDDGSAPSDVVTLGVGEIASMRLTLDVGDATGHGKAVASAVAGQSIAATRFRAYVAEPALELSASVLSGSYIVAPGTEPRFVVPVRGAGDGAPPVTVSFESSHLELADGAISAPTVTGSWGDTVVGAGNSIALETDPTLVPTTLADGIYGGTIHVEGVDANGATVAVDLPLDEDALTVDSDVPTADLRITPQGAAARDGDDVSFGGTIVDGDEPCERCYLRDEGFESYDADGNVVGFIPVSEKISDDSNGLFRDAGWENTDGNLSGFWPVGEWPTDAVATRWVATVVDYSGLSSPAASPLIDVDNVAPAIVSANAGDVRVISVALSEPVTPPFGSDFAPGDWTCTGTNVQRATLGGIGDVVVLSLGADLDRNATPTCTYSPQVRPATDRMGYELPPGSVVATDGVAPVAPTIDTIGGRSVDSGAFFVNTSTPTLSISHVQAGDAIAVYEILADGTDALIASGTASGPTIELTPSSLGGIDRSLDLYAQATDPAGGDSGWASVRLVLDFTAPTLSAAEISRAAGSRDVVLRFAEPLVGPAAANDWAVFNGAQGYTVSVRISGGTVTLTVSDSRFQPLTMTLNGVAYDVLATDGSTRLTDRAGNVLADSSRSF